MPVLDCSHEKEALVLNFQSFFSFAIEGKEGGMESTLKLRNRIECIIVEGWMVEMKKKERETS
jgi:hypothetical protein